MSMRGMAYACASKTRPIAVMDFDIHAIILCCNTPAYAKVDLRRRNSRWDQASEGPNLDLS